MTVVVNVELVNNVLYQACYSSDFMIQQQAMQALQEFEQQTGYLIALTQVLQSSDVLTDQRLLAVISIKNIVARCWNSRSSTRRSLLNDEKAYLRNFICSMLLEPDKKVAMQVTALIAKICSADWPQDWPELIPGLLTVIQPGNSWLAQRRGLYALLEVANELSHKTLPTAKLAFQAAMCQMLPTVAALWMQLAGAVVFETGNISRSIGVIGEVGLGLSSVGVGCSEVQGDPVSLFDHFCVSTTLLKTVLVKGYANIFNELEGLSSPKCASGFGIEPDRLHSALGNLVPHFFQCFSIFAQLHRLLVGVAPVTSLDDGDYEGITAVNDVDDEEDECYFDSCSLALDSTLHHHLQPAIRCLHIVIKEMSIVPVHLLSKYPIEMAPHWLGPSLTACYDHLHAEYENVGVDGRRPCGYHRSSCIAAITFISDVLSCIKFEPSAQSSINKRIVPSRPQRGVVYSADQLDVQDRTTRLIAIADTAFICRQVFFSSERLQALLQLLFMHLMHLPPSDLLRWKSDPEAFYLKQQGETSRSCVKSAAELLFLSILDTDSDLTCRLLLVFLENVRCMPLSNDNSNIMICDSVYLGIGLASTCLSRGYLDATNWLNSSLGPTINTMMSTSTYGVHPEFGCQVLRCRILWLLACWTHNFHESVISSLVQLSLAALSPQSQSDVVVMLTAVDTLQALIRSDSFSANMILPYLSQAVYLLCQLTNTVLSDDECQSHAVATIGELLIVLDSAKASMQHELQSLVPALGDHLQSLWQHSSQQSPLKTTVLEVASRIVKVSRSHSIQIHRVVLPMIFASTSSVVETEYLFKDGINLWLHAIRNVPVAAYSSSLGELLAVRLPLIIEKDGLGNELEDLKPILLIVEAYAILGGASCLQQCCHCLIGLYNKLLGEVSPRVVPFIIRTMEAFFLSCPMEFLQFLLESRLLLKMLRGCGAATESLSVALQDFQEADVSIVSYMSIFARIAIIESSWLEMAISSLFSFEGCEAALLDYRHDQHHLLRSLFRLLVDKFDSVGYCTAGMWRRRLWLLALLSLYPTADPELLQWFGEVMNIASDVLTEDSTEEGQARTTSLFDAMVSCEEEDDEMVVWNANEYDDDDDDEHVNANIDPIVASNGAAAAVAEVDVDNSKEAIVVAFASLLATDAVCRADISGLIREKLLQLRALLGDDQMFRAVLDSSASCGCGEFLSIFVTI